VSPSNSSNASLNSSNTSLNSSTNNSSNVTLNNASDGSEQPKPSSAAIQRGHVLRELISTEVEYEKDLATAIHILKPAIVGSMLVPHDDVAKMFSNMETIYEVCIEFLKMLQVMKIQ
jgi:hypothetical protein